MVGPVLDAEKVEEGVAAKGAGPGGVGGTDTLEADEAGDVGAAAGGRGQEGSDLGQVRGGAARDLEVGGEDRVLKGGAAARSLLAAAAAAGVRIGEDNIGIRIRVLYRKTASGGSGGGHR